MSRIAASVLTLSLLAACAGQQGADLNPTVQVQQAAQYAAHARGDYVPPGPADDPWGPYIREAASRFDIPEEWIRAVMGVESGGDEYRGGQLITSNAGAMGLMQVMPETYQELENRYSLGGDPFDPHDNIIAGVGYMRELYDIYGSPGFLAAYNAGPNRLDDYLADERSLPAETRRYVAMIAPEIAGIYPARLSPAQSYAMNDLPDDIPPGLRYGGTTLVAARHPDHVRHVRTHERMLARATTRSRITHATRPVEVAMVLPPPEPSHRFRLALYRRDGFRLFPEAQAAEMTGPHRGDAGWTVQVGAFTSQAVAERAASHARASSGFAHARVAIETVRDKHGRLYRARVVDLSRDAAETACHKLVPRRNCMVISPESRF